MAGLEAERLGSWLVYTAAFEKAGWLKDEAPIAEERNYSDACWLLLKVCAASLAALHGASVKHQGSAGARRLAEAAGINVQQTHGDLRNTCAARLFQEASKAMRTPQPDSAPLFLPPLRWLVIKTDGVQAMIQRARKPYLMRGASVWAARFLGHVRDKVDDAWSPGKGAPGLLLMIDADAVAQWLIIGACDPDALCHKLKELLTRYVHDEEGVAFIEHCCPRLMPWARRAREKGISPACGFPALSLRVSEQVTLSAAGEAEGSSSSDRAERWAACARVEWPPATGGTGMTSCDLVENDTALFDQDPPWWKRGDEPMSFGWRALLWGHAGAMHRVYQRDCLRMRQPDARDVPWVHHGDWVKQLKDAGLGDLRLALIKLDGDGVGELFRRCPVLERSALSLGIAGQFDQMLTEALEASKQALASLAAKYEAAQDAPPIDILYIGGDDHLYCIPHALSQSFLRALEDGGRKQCARRRVEKISVAVITMPNPRDGSDGGTISELAGQLVEPVLELAKGRGTAGDEANIHADCRKIGLDAHLLPLPITDDRGMLHGLWVDLRWRLSSSA